MEVHHHAHTPRKKWTHYFWEFLMLFLAVFCGFLAENFREHKVERVREKEYIQSLIKDLEYDTLQYGKTITRLLDKISYYDSVFLFFKTPSSFNYSLPYRIYSATASEQFYTPAKQTIEQMKGSGNLRLIHKKDCLDSILAYDSYLSGPYKNQTEYAVGFNKRMQNSLEKIFDFSGLNRLLNDMNGNSMSGTDSIYDLKLISDNKNSIQEVYNIHVSAKGTEVFYVNVIRRTKSLASRLINFLNTEYHLK